MAQVVFMIRVFSHRKDVDGITENQLVAPVYLTEEVANIDAEKLRERPFYSKVEVEKISLVSESVF